MTRPFLSLAVVVLHSDCMEEFDDDHVPEAHVVRSERVQRDPYVDSDGVTMEWDYDRQAYFPKVYYMQCTQHSVMMMIKRSQTLMHNSSIQWFTCCR